MKNEIELINNQAKIINMAYEMSTILSFAFSLDFMIVYRNISLINRLMLCLWMAITGMAALRIVLNRVILNRTKEKAFDKGIKGVKEVFKDIPYASTIYIVIGFLILIVRVAIPFIIAL